MRHAVIAASLLLMCVGPGCGSKPETADAPTDAKPEQNRIQIDPKGVEIALWPDGAAIARPEATGPEEATYAKEKVAGRLPKGIRNVTRPTMTIYSPRGANTGTALMVYPGGGYQALAIDLEGTEVCDWATAKGITCVVLKYRVPQKWWHADCHCQRRPDPFLPLQDAQRAMVLLRQRATRLGIDPHRIGVVGFSAGGHLVTAISNATGRAYAAVDAADKLSARPDFAMPIYPGHLWSGEGGGGEARVDLFDFDPIAADGPPAFIVAAEDDPVDDVRNSVAYFLALKAKKVPAEMHLYAHGGHAFGVRPTDQPISRWPALAETWLHTIGMLKEAER
jgi:acetyl esterase/lipase